MLFFRGYHHEDPVGPDAPFFQFNGPVHGRLPDGNGGQDHIFHVDAFFGGPADKIIAPKVCQEGLGITELGHAFGIAQVGHLNIPASGKDQFFQIGDLGLC